MKDSNCIFCKIANKEIESTVLAETENLIAIKDLNPVAELHALIIPKNHYRDVVDLTEKDPSLLQEITKLAKKIATEFAPASSNKGEFKLVFNTGESAGQTIFHVHGHVLAGKVKKLA